MLQAAGFQKRVHATQPPILKLSAGHVGPNSMPRRPSWQEDNDTLRAAASWRRGVLVPGLPEQSLFFPGGNGPCSPSDVGDSRSQVSQGESQ